MRFEFISYHGSLLWHVALLISFGHQSHYESSIIKSPVYFLSNFCFKLFSFDKIFSCLEITALIFKWKLTEIEHIFFKKRVKITMIKGKKIKKLFWKFLCEIQDYLFKSEKNKQTPISILYSLIVRIFQVIFLTWKILLNQFRNVCSFDQNIFTWCVLQMCIYPRFSEDLLILLYIESFSSVL